MSLVVSEHLKSKTTYRQQVCHHMKQKMENFRIVKEKGIEVKAHK